MPMNGLIALVGLGEYLPVKEQELFFMRQLTY